MIDEIKRYTPWDEKEAAEKEMMLQFLQVHGDALERSCLAGHVTVSAWVVNPEHTKVLMAYHNLYDSWAWLGGHADGCADPLDVAIKETCEEAGLEMGDLNIPTGEIFSLEVLPVDGHVKKGQWVPSHLHLNLTYLLEAPEECTLKVNEEENSAVAWFTFDDAMKASKEPWFVEHIYSKLVKKLKGN